MESPRILLQYKDCLANEVAGIFKKTLLKFQTFFNEAGGRSTLSKEQVRAIKKKYLAKDPLTALELQAAVSQRQDCAYNENKQVLNALIAQNIQKVLMLKYKFLASSSDLTKIELVKEFKILRDQASKLGCLNLHFMCEYKAIELTKTIHYLIFIKNPIAFNCLWVLN